MVKAQEAKRSVTAALHVRAYILHDLQGTMHKMQSAIWPFALPLLLLWMLADAAAVFGMADLFGRRNKAEDKETAASSTLQRAAIPITSAKGDFSPLLEAIGDSRFVLLGEASHGTHEFYQARAEITKRLIKEKGFRAVAVEADWPDAYRVNRYVRGTSQDTDARTALSDFKRFPTWMWRNEDVVELVDWLHEWNEGQPTTSTKAGFYGIDLYSLNSSISAVLDYLDKVDPDAAERARYRYSCFEDFGSDPARYGQLASGSPKDSCEDAVTAPLVEMLRQRGKLVAKDGAEAGDEFFYAVQNARVVENAEEYYRAMYRSNAQSWNLRDTHMFETLIALADHLGEPAEPAKIVVWAHNSHLGNAAATEMAKRGELNVGQLVKQRYPDTSFLVGFTTYDGTVSAARNWDQPVERRYVRPALAGSYEALFHEVGIDNFLLLPGPDSEATRLLDEPRLERAIGVIYRPETERQSHYFEARLPSQFDAVLHFDNTRAVTPLERTAIWEKGEEGVPDTYPFGL